MTPHSPAPMPQEVDFLPASYHQRRERRKIKLWRGTILSVAVLLSLLGSGQQFYRHRALCATRDKLEQQVLDSFAQLQGADAKRQRITVLEAQANLVTQLRMCVAPTRLMDAVVDALPEYISLTEFRLERNRISATSTRNRRDQPQPADAAEQQSGAAQDLEQLLKERSQTALSVTLTGVAPDDLSISAYLAALKRTGLFDDIQPLYTDESEYRQLPLRAFSVRLTVRRPAMGTSANTAGEDVSGPVASGPRNRRPTVDSPRHATRPPSRSRT